MRLEKIVLDGFKSFADKTEFTFENSITGIVGPNGCGKSNIVDAVKWVLGEQSVKSLRSGHMSDVIFSGSSSRKAVGTAEVSLFFSNTSGQLPIESDEVVISRRIYKSGECEYRINNKITRLRDIRELFMDTGVGAKAYSIIEQGQIAQLLTSSKTDRRVIFEEAAGISKYKAHKKEALRKLENTNQNLLRLADILGEVQKRLRSVKLQAGKARNYLQYTQRLKELQVNYSLAEFDKINCLNKEKGDALSEIEEQLASVAAELGKKEALAGNLGHRILETESRINNADNSLVTVQSKIEQNLQQIDFLRTRIEELEQRKTTATQRSQTLRDQKEQFEKDLSQYREELINCEKGLEQKSSEASEVEKSINEINAKCRSLEADLEDEKSGIIDIVRRTAQLHNEIQSISIHRNDLSSQKNRLASRAETGQAELEKFLTEKAQHKARLDDIEKVLSELTESLDSKVKKSEELEKLVSTDNKRLANSKEARSAIASELAILTDMEKRGEGVGPGVKSILAKKATEDGKFDYVEGLLADIIASNVKYAGAVEAALESKTSAVVINSSSRLLCDTDTIEKLEGRVQFLCTDNAGPFVDKMDFSKFPSVKGRLVEFVSYDAKYSSLVWKLLGKTIVTDSLEEAARLAEQLSKEYKFVTLKGEFLNSEGIIKIGPLGKATGLISRKSRLRQLQKTIDDITAEVEAVEQQIEKNTQENEHLVKLCKELRTAVYEAKTEQVQVNSKLSGYEQNIKRLTEEQPLIASEIEQLEAQINQSVQKEYDSKQKLEELQEVNNQRTTHIKEIEINFSEQKQLQHTQSSYLTDLRVSLGQTAEQIKGLKQTIESVHNQIKANVAATEAAKTESNNCIEQSEQNRRDILKYEAAVSELFVEKEKSQHGSRELHEELEKLLEEQEQTEQIIRQKREEKSEIDQKISGLKVELGQLEIKQQDLVERVRDELQIDLATAFEQYEGKDVDWEQVREEINELRGKIERLGNVNIDAIEEQENLEGRNEFLSSQVEDLNSSKAQLQQLINRLNKQSREKFVTTFEEIRLNFQQIFRKLFGGGKADIFLVDAEDVLEAGIEITARPPGKETRSISLLSGGEKTMTAIALLFSVFKTKPSPFCLLDEVDAALDEANNERFNLLIREFEKDSQFVIITHAKRTMSIVEQLYGITMQTRGVSKKISVQFGDITEEETAAVA